MCNGIGLMIRWLRYRPETTEALASLFESFLWLHLGTEIGVFPLQLSAEIASSYYQPFFQSLNARRDNALDEVEFASKLYVYDTPESKDLKAAFPGFTILIERAMRGEDGLKVQRSEFNSPDSLKPLFKNFLRLASMIRMDPRVRHFTVVSQFATEVEWQNEWRGGDCAPEEVEDFAAQVDLKDRSAASIFAGFLRLWSYSHQLTAMVEMYEHEEIRGEDRFKLVDRIKEILRWRINLRSAETANRFEAVRSALKTNLDRQAMQEGNLKGAVDFIKKSFDSAFAIWIVYQFATA
jgi:hypothetical protein